MASASYTQFDTAGGHLANYLRAWSNIFDRLDEECIDVGDRDIWASEAAELLSQPGCCISLEHWVSACKFCLEFWLDCAIGRRFETSQTEAFQQQSAVYREALGYRGYGIFERIALELVDYAVDAKASILNVTIEDKRALVGCFGWCRGFHSAFYSGVAAVADWVMELGIGRRALGLSTGLGNMNDRLFSLDTPAAVAGKVQALREYLTKHYESRSDYNDVAEREELDREAEEYKQSDTEYTETSDGIGQVWVTSGSDGSRTCIALVVKVPALLLDERQSDLSQRRTPSGEGALPGGAFIAQDLGVAVRGVIPALRSIKLTKDSAPVLYETVILTLPRLHFLLECAAANALSCPGLQLDGVHGVGKSTLLRALTSCLCVGGPVDSWFLPKAEHAFLPAGAASFLSTSTGSVMNMLDKRPSVTVAARMAAWARRYTRQEKAIDVAEWTSKNIFEMDLFEGNKLTVFDGVDKVLSERDRSKLLFLRWNNTLRRNHLRILSSSPRGQREAVAGEHRVPFFELRPAPAHHMAAIVAVVPWALTPLLPPTSRFDYSVVEPACKFFAGNMRQISRVLVEAMSSIKPAMQAAGLEGEQENSIFSRTVSTVGRDYIEHLAKRMIADIDLTPHKFLEYMQRRHGGADSPAYFVSEHDIRMTNASLLVRRKPCDRHGAVDIVGSIASMVQMRAAANPHSQNTQGGRRTSSARVTGRSSHIAASSPGGNVRSDDSPKTSGSVASRTRASKRSRQAQQPVRRERKAARGSAAATPQRSDKLCRTS